MKLWCNSFEKCPIWILSFECQNKIQCYNNKRQHKTAWKMCSVYINKITKKISKSRIAVLRGSEIKWKWIFCVCISRSLLLNALILHSTRVIKLELKTTSSSRTRRRRRRGRIKGKWNKKKTNFFNSKRAIDVSGTAELCKSQKNNKTHKMWVVTLTEFTVISKSQTHGRNAQNILDDFSLLRDLQWCLMHTSSAFIPNFCIASDNSRMNSHPHMCSSSSSTTFLCIQLGMF